MSNVSKVLGRVIENRLVKEVEQNKLICNEQRGFRAGVSTMTNVKDLYDFLGSKRAVLKEERDNKVPVL